jgi:hypothetical protein
MNEADKNVKIIFKDFYGCPVIDMPITAYDRLVNEVLNYNIKRFIDFDEVITFIRQISISVDGFDCVALSDWWFNTPTAKYYWPKDHMLILFKEEPGLNRVIISGLKNKYNEEKTMARVKAGGDFGMALAMRGMRGGLTYSAYRRPTSSVHIKDVIFNDPATIVFWSDGTKTVCTCSEADTYDPEKGLALCCMKKVLYDNKGHIFNNAREKWLKKGAKKR